MTVDRIERLLRRLTREELLALTAGSDLWHTAAVPRLGIPRIKLSDGPSGVRGESFVSGRSTCFPCGSALGATWNPQLVGRVAGALAREARAKGVHVLLGPTVNMHRVPLAGRSFECFSEDPHLTARLAIAYVRGLQSNGVAATVKHFVCNDSEFERMSISSEVGERALREIYLPPFEAAVVEAGAWAVMAAYNRLNGTHCCEHPLLTSLLKGEWRFDGVVVSDWFGTRSSVPSARAGLDLEMPGPAHYFGAGLLPALDAGEVGENAIEDKARRLLRLAVRTGALDQAEEIAESSPDPEQHRRLARQAAAESIVLLANASGVLPLEAASLRTLAVIGQNAEVPAIQGGGSARVNSHPAIAPLDAIRRLCPGVEIGYEAGCFIDRGCPPLDRRLLGAPLVLRYFSGHGPGGEAVLTEEAPEGRLFWIGAPGPGLTPGDYTVRGGGRLVPRVSGAHTFSLTSAGRSRLLLDGRPAVDNWDGWTAGDSFFGLGSTEVRQEVELLAGRSYDLAFELEAGPAPIAGIAVGCAAPRPSDELDRAVALAARSDAAVVVVGTGEDWETEGRDRETMALPGRQAELIRRVAAANPRTIVVVNAGASVGMDWADDAAAVVQSWFGGEEAGPALADVLLGRADPGGRLPMTIPRRLEDTPAWAGYPGENGAMRYDEDLLVGYRGFDQHDVAPRYCFGHGLSYATFRWESLEAERTELRAGEALAVWARVTNTGRRAGWAVVQLYVGRAGDGHDRPVRELRAFAKTWLEAGTTRAIRLELDGRAFARWDVETAAWAIDPGRYQLTAGASSRDLPLTAQVRLQPAL